MTLRVLSAVVLIEMCTATSDTLSVSVHRAYDVLLSRSVHHAESLLFLLVIMGSFYHCPCGLSLSCV